MRESFQRAAVQFSGALLLALLVGACEGNVLGESGQPAPANPGGAGTGSIGEQGGDTCTEAPGAMYLRRLTNQEYADTVRDLLGGEVSVTVLPPDLTLYGFD